MIFGLQLRHLKQCAGKTAHGTAAEARREMRKSGLEGLSVYQCSDCGAWHIGHATGTVRRSAAGRDRRERLTELRLSEAAQEMHDYGH